MKMIEIKICKYIFFSCVVLLCAQFLLAFDSSAQQNNSDKEIVSESDKYLSNLSREGKFSGSVLLARSNKVLLKKGYGSANRQYEISNTPQTKFLLASMTKQFTALGIMMLQEEGKINIKDSICKYIVQCPDYWQAVTLQQLLNHTSGITEFGKPQPENDCFRRTPMSTSAAVERVKQFKPDFIPGEKFAYSSAGYILLGFVIEKVTGKNYEAFLKANVLDPLKMTNTGQQHQKQLNKNLAAGYSRARDGSISNFDYFNLDYLFSAGGLYSTIEDLYLYDQALYTEKLVKQNTLNQMFIPGLENSGFGWEIFQRYNHRLIRSDGRSFGFSNSMVRFPDQKITVIVLSNIDTAGAAKIADDLSVFFFDKHENQKKTN
jgi:CubicO group peptidase (beta-lactamase class C family)